MVNDFENRGHATLAARDNHALIAIARLRPGMTLAAADAQLAGVAAAMQKAWPVENKDQTLLVRPLSRLNISTSPSSDNGLAVPAILLLCMAAVVLLIASLNVANMMLARGAARRKEIAIRLALGGGRRDIVQQLLSESLMLALMGGAAGLFIAWWSTEVLVSSMSRLAPLDLVYHATPDLRVLGRHLRLLPAQHLAFRLHAGLESLAARPGDRPQGRRARAAAVKRGSSPAATCSSWVRSASRSPC